MDVVLLHYLSVLCGTMSVGKSCKKEACNNCKYELNFQIYHIQIQVCVRNNNE